MMNNLKIAARFLFRHRSYSLVNIGGLTFSLIAVLLIALYLYDELSFDKTHSKADRIYRVVENQIDRDGNRTNLADVAFRVSTLKDEIPAVEETFKLISFGRSLISTDENENKFYEQYAFAEQTFFSMFDYKVIFGNRDKALSEPFTAVMTKSAALRMFGTEDVVGKIIHTDRDDEPYTIAAVIDDFPSNSHLDFNILYSFATLLTGNLYKQIESDWSSNYFSVYYLLKDASKRAEVETSLTEIVNNNRSSDGLKGEFWLQPLTEIHFNSGSIRGGYATTYGDITYVYIFGIVGLFIIVIALVNYINLATAMSSTRGREIGVKKVTGANWTSLASQFILESVLITFAALLLAIAITNILLPSFNSFAGKTITIDVLLKPKVIASLVGFALVVGIIAGSYPALRLSSLKPVMAFKGTKATGRGWMRQSLVVLQFFLSIGLIIATLTAYRQIEYVRSKDLGFNEEHLVITDINSGKVRRSAETIKSEMLKLSGVSSVSVSSRVPGEWKNLPQVKTIIPGREAVACYFIGADEDYLQTFQIKLLKGNNFTGSSPSDSTSVLINEAAARELGITEPGQEVSIPAVNIAVSYQPLVSPFNVKVIGIVHDFNFQSLHQAVAPLMIAYQNNPIHSIDYFTLRMTTDDMQSRLKEMQSIMYSIDPSHVLEYNFLDERLADFYKQDVQRSRLFAIAAVVAVGLACLGLFSLVSFNTEQRTKEIGVRKVLGASTTQITVLLCSQYVKLVLIGFIVATPVSIWVLNKWLNSFAYRIDIGWLILVVAFITSFTVTMATVGFKSMRAAWANPADSLHTE